MNFLLWNLGHPLKGSQEFLLEDTFRLLVSYLILIFYPIIDSVDDLNKCRQQKNTWGPLKISWFFALDLGSYEKKLVWSVGSILISYKNI